MYLLIDCLLHLHIISILFNYLNEMTFIVFSPHTNGLTKWFHHAIFKGDTRFHQGYPVRMGMYDDFEPIYAQFHHQYLDKMGMYEVFGPSKCGLSLDAPHNRHVLYFQRSNVRIVSGHPKQSACSWFSTEQRSDCLWTPHTIGMSLISTE